LKRERLTGGLLPRQPCAAIGTFLKAFLKILVYAPTLIQVKRSYYSTLTTSIYYIADISKMEFDNDPGKQIVPNELMQSVVLY
jgi:hypothetical protein